MDHRQLGSSGLRVPVLSFGTATFGGGEGIGSWGNTQVDEARRVVDLALDAGIDFFDTADIYSGGRAEEILGRAVTGRRDQVLIGTKANGRTGPGANDVGSSRSHLTRALEASLRRLDTEYVDVLWLHAGHLDVQGEVVFRLLHVKRRCECAREWGFGVGEELGDDSLEVVRPRVGGRHRTTHHFSCHGDLLVVRQEGWPPSGQSKRYCSLTLPILRLERRRLKSFAELFGDF